MRGRQTDIQTYLEITQGGCRCIPMRNTKTDRRGVGQTGLEMKKGTMIVTEAAALTPADKIQEARDHHWSKSHALH